MSISNEASAQLKNSAASLTESAAKARALVSELHEAVRRIDANVTGLLGADVRSVNSAIASYQRQNNLTCALDGLKSCIDNVRSVVTAARTAGYQEQREPGIRQTA
jgi:hypothetical protein